MNSDRHVEMTAAEVLKDEREIKEDIMELLQLLSMFLGWFYNTVTGHSAESTCGNYAKAASVEMMKQRETRVPLLIAFEQHRIQKKVQTRAAVTENDKDLSSQRLMVNKLLLDLLNAALANIGIPKKATKFQLQKLLSSDGYFGLKMVGFPIKRSPNQRSANLLKPRAEIFSLFWFQTRFTSLMEVQAAVMLELEAAVTLDPVKSSVVTFNLKHCQNQMILSHRSRLLNYVRPKLFLTKMQLLKLLLK
ncbi:hypothetical protein BDR26DRAFT_861128 [Obelidium mucronatum]|nr:hypothetical protein BDR26DRAFT_861128 [Obelidium mucronatum]